MHPHLEALTAATELRRLVALNAELVAALEALLTYTADLNPLQGYEEWDHPAVKLAFAATAKAHGAESTPQPADQPGNRS